MTSRERVINTINSKKTDRMPIHGWLKINLDDKISEKYGSVTAFEDKYEFDLRHIFPGVWPHQMDKIKEIKKAKGEITPADYLSIDYYDPDNEDSYNFIKQEINTYKEKEKFTYVQTVGVFESLNSVFGIENHLMYLLLYPDDLKKVYERQAGWAAKVANNCIDLGVDMIHVSDDWGSQESLLFSPDIFESLIKPAHQIISEAVKKRDSFISLHSDGNITQAFPGIVELGYDVVHPFQVSAGMDYNYFEKEYKDKIVLMGGIDVQMTLGFNKKDLIEKEVRDVVARFKEGGLILNTTHYVQDHTSLEELEFCYDLVYELIRK